MSDETNLKFPIAITIAIKDSFSERWLQDQICNNPSILTLGDLEFVSREKIQWKNGRVDILLKDEDGGTMYEVEVMLGETDEKHIIHTIEYWDNEKRKFPQRQHFPVLVAESFDRRFFNIIHLFSQTIPLIAVQVKLVEVAGSKCLHFSKIIDIYQEPEETEIAAPEYNEAFWIEKAAWTVEAAKTLLEIIKPVFPNGRIHTVKSYITIEVDGTQHVWIKNKSNNKSEIKFWISDGKMPEGLAVLEKAEINVKKEKEHLSFLMDSNSLKKHSRAIIDFANITKDAWAFNKDILPDDH
jgi:hypothetical protein